MPQNVHAKAHWMVVDCRIFGLLAAAYAQTPSPSAGNTRFDGTYAFVSATKVNETFRDYNNEERPCRNMGDATSLVIVSGRAQYTAATGYLVEETVGQQGELTMRYPPDPEGRHGGISPSSERPVNGRIESDGTVRARQIGFFCSHDLIWQKSAH